ncbi:MAG TPA: hypothetical protein VHJ38_06685 [Nitrososphaeraceae archaeon]|jgi:hypothetical protein|nr:hypothetical protein [Nitrososphaeraceae archaeon]
MRNNQHLIISYVQFLDIAYELAKIDKVKVIEIVKNNKNKKFESVSNLLD